MLEGNEGTYFRHVPVSDDGSVIASTWRKLPTTAIVELEIEPVANPERKCKVCWHFEQIPTLEVTGIHRVKAGVGAVIWGTKKAVESNKYPTVHSLSH